ncbi:MAG: hypothetical protein SH848_01835 [Saprospiraceae bacterium]|nr:hypothetical protein [Saprospiraceae bacterium]MDZ4702637.1 hypothetical protein [Saprospiraceae bacterium]
MADPLLNFETYAATLQSVMATAIEEAEALRDAAAVDREAAADDNSARLELLNNLENQTRRKAEDELAARYGQLKLEMIADIARKLKASGKSEEEIEVLRKALGGAR